MSSTASSSVAVKYEIVAVDVFKGLTAAVKLVSLFRKLDHVKDSAYVMVTIRRSGK